ncbi:unnamed protein product [Alternaria alternata]
MDSRFAYHMSYGVFGSPSPAFGVSTASTNSFGSSTGSGGAVSTFSAATRSCLVSGQSWVGTVSGSSGSMTAGFDKPWTSDIEMEDAPEASSDHVAVIPNTTTTLRTSVSTLSAAQAREHGSKPAEMSKDEASAKSPSVSPPNPARGIVLPPTPASQREESEETSAKVQPLGPADITKPAMSSPPVEDTKSSVTPSSMVDTEPAVSSTPLESIKVAVSLPSMENDSHEAGRFEDDIELEDDVADWRGKLDILMAKLETYAGPDANRIVSNTRIQLEKVFVILGGAENIGEEVT